MTDCNPSVGSWATETDTYDDSTKEFASHGSTTKPHQEAFDHTDLRHKLRRDRGENDSGEHSSASSRHSPLKSPTRPRRHRNAHGESNQASRPNYARGKDGLSPLRSPLNSDQRSSRVNTSSRRRSIRGEEASKKENELPKESSPSKKNKYAHSTSIPSGTLNLDLEEQKFRRRLDLQTEEQSDNEEQGGTLDPDVEEDRITLDRREKQIGYGKRTESYQLYIKSVPKDQRALDRRRHPQTPDKNMRLSRRNFDAQIKAWKKHVHQWANVNFPAMAQLSCPSSTEAESESSSMNIDENKEETKEEEDNDNIDLNEEDDDESFLEGFELDYELGEPPLESNPASKP